jgi:Flp pilus assembly protein TadG
MVYRFRSQRRDGVAAAELACLLPFLSFTVLVAIDFCRAYYCTQTLQAAADAAALYASGTALPAVASTAQEAAVQAAVAQCTTLQPALSSSDVAVTTANGVASVTVTYQFNMLFGGLGGSGHFTMIRSVSMPVAPQPTGGW